MNERIEKLARLAGGKSTYGTLRGPIVPPPPGWFDHTTVDLEKFAELIIQDCVNTINHRADTSADYLDSKKANEHARQVQRDCATTLEYTYGLKAMEIAE